MKSFQDECWWIISLNEHILLEVSGLYVEERRHCKRSDLQKEQKFRETNKAGRHKRHFRTAFKSYPCIAWTIANVDITALAAQLTCKWAVTLMAVAKRSYDGNMLSVLAVWDKHLSMKSADDRP